MSRWKPSFVLRAPDDVTVASLVLTAERLQRCAVVRMLPGAGTRARVFTWKEARVLATLVIECALTAGSPPADLDEFAQQLHASRVSIRSPHPTRARNPQNDTVDFLLVTQAPAYRLSSNSLATESAFAKHLLELRDTTRGDFTRLVLVAPLLTRSSYESVKPTLSVIDSTTTGIVFSPTYQTGIGSLKLALEMPKIIRRVSTYIRRASVVQVDLAYDIRRPATFIIAIAARANKKPVAFAVDTDFRRHARRFRQLGEWGLARYFINQYIYIPLRLAQVQVAVRLFQLVLLKSPSLVKDYGQGREHVHAFLDAVHSESDIIDSVSLAERVRAASDKTGPFRLTYFGRLVPYKGVDRIIEAVSIARKSGRNVTLDIIGDGTELPKLTAQVQRLNIGNHIRFHPTRPYGPELFALLMSAHASVAAPLVEDTPRAALDALARGLPVAAFDISYFKDLAEASGAIELAAWPDPRALSNAIGRLDDDRANLAARMQAAVAFARDNTQRKWLEQRLEWIRGLSATTVTLNQAKRSAAER